MLATQKPESFSNNNLSLDLFDFHVMNANKNYYEVRHLCSRKFVYEVY